MIFKLAIDCDNAAFGGEDCGPELARILHALAKRVEDRGESDLLYLISEEKPLFDINGNHCGDYWIEVEQ